MQLRYIGEKWKYPACSCKEIVERKPNSTSGYYWVQGVQAGRPNLVYCDTEREFIAGETGWLRVANWDMRNPHHQCPGEFRLRRQNGLRLCGKTTDGRGCNSVSYSTHGLTYRQVCGRVTAFHYASPHDGFYRFHCRNPCGIDDDYVDGVSITHGNSPRKHIWTFSASGLQSNLVPDFVGDNYFCEAGHNGRPWPEQFFTDDPLWDGDCQDYDTECCEKPGLPWFCTDLPEPTNNDIEVRLCTDESLSNEDVPIQLVELYVR